MIWIIEAISQWRGKKYNFFYCCELPTQEHKRRNNDGEKDGEKTNKIDNFVYINAWKNMQNRVKYVVHALVL